MRFVFILATTVAFATALNAQTAPDPASQGEGESNPINDIIGEGTSASPDLAGQDIDPTQDYLTALTRAAEKGPILKVSPDKVFFAIEEGESAKEIIRLTNTGDKSAPIKGISSLGVFEGLSLTHACPDILPSGEYCDITIAYESSVEGNIQTIVLINAEERQAKLIEIPITITVKPPEIIINPEDENPDETNNPTNGSGSQNGQNIPKTKPLTDKDIARLYYRSMGGIVPRTATGSLSVVSLPESMKKKKDKTFSERIDGEVFVETITADPRYPEDIPSTEAGLPVDRSKILTSDRVIKAVLDTPFSNVMCGKVVAIVESDVYSATSSVPLIQAGSRVVGKCGEMIKERSSIVWERIITVDGRSISLAGNDTMTRDAGGLGGALGHLYKTPFDRFMLPIFSSIVDVGAGVVTAKYGEDESSQVAEDGTVVQNSSAKNKGIQIATEGVRSAADDIINEIKDVREVLVIPSGTRIDIEISQDIYFKDEREVVRIADTVYDVPRSPAPIAPKEQASPIVLVPYQPGMEGPVVTVDGRRFLIQEGVVATQAQQNEQNRTRPIAEDPNADQTTGGTQNTQTGNATQDTLNDLSSMEKNTTPETSKQKGDG